MIKTSRQLKDLIRNRAGGDSGKAQLLLRNYAMERLLERISLSPYKDNFILKGGILVSAMVGLDNRATMDIDTTVRNLPLDPENAERIVAQIVTIPVDDNISFQIREVMRIMDETEYGGVRLSLNALLDTTRIPLKLDISTGDQITPSEVSYRYKLMFEERYISLWAYNLETVLAEKLETILSRATLNTRLRDFYDLYILQNTGLQINPSHLCAAIKATCLKRGSIQVLPRYVHILNDIEASDAMRDLWSNFQRKNDYAEKFTWADIMASIHGLCSTAGLRAFSEFQEGVYASLTEGLDAFYTLREEAKASGIGELSLDEVNAEIRKARQEMTPEEK